MNEITLDTVRPIRAVSSLPIEPATPADPWRCEGGEIDQCGPVFLRNGQIHKACTEHWEGVMRVLGEQESWQRTDGARSGPADG